MLTLYPLLVLISELSQKIPPNQITFLGPSNHNFPSLFRNKGQQSPDPSQPITLRFLLATWPEDPLFNDPDITPVTKNLPQQKTAVTLLPYIFISSGH